jgi:hypothetical protein
MTITPFKKLSWKRKPAYIGVVQKRVKQVPNFRNKIEEETLATSQRQIIVFNIKNSFILMLLNYTQIS